LAPCERVTNSAINWIGAIFGERDNVGLRFHSGKLSASTCSTGANNHDPKPRLHVRMYSVGEQVDRERAGSEIEDCDPDGPMREAVGQLVALPNLALA